MTNKEEERSMREIENYCVGCETCVHCGRDKNVEIITCDICGDQIEGDSCTEDDESGRPLDLCKKCMEKVDFLASYIDKEPYSTFVEILRQRPEVDMEDAGEMIELVSRYYQSRITRLNIKISKLSRGGST